MNWIRILVVVLGVFLGGWLAFDGGRALVVGDYVTPSRGRFAGQLGPWSKLSALTGLDPRSTPVKLLHVGVGLLWLTAAIALLLGTSWSWTLAFIAAICSLWYLPFGTMIAVIEIALLFTPTMRNASP